jgi:hypothetical protein
MKSLFFAPLPFARVSFPRLSFAALSAFLVVGILTPALVRPAAAQSAAAPSFGGRANALGGSGTAQVIGHPLGGVIAGSGFRGVKGFDRGNRGEFNKRRSGFAAASAYSFFVPNYFDNSDYYSYGPYANGTPYMPADNGPSSAPENATSQQPVIINQYFGTQEPQQVNTQAPSPAPSANEPQNPGDPIGTPQNYYLIAYKNHTVYAALAYWVEDKTLNYVTTENQHNQASLDAIDLQLTKRLNQDREVPFSIPGQQGQ